MQFVFFRFRFKIKCISIEFHIKNQTIKQTIKKIKKKYEN